MIRKLKFRKNKRGKGIALIELAIILGVLSILTIGSMVAVGPQIRKANDAKRKVDLDKIAKAVEEYNTDTDCYPSALPECGQDFSLNGKTYLSNFPCDPKEVPYGYETSNLTCNTWYKLLANLENASDKSIERTGCQQGCGLNCTYNYGISSPNIAPYDGCFAEISPTFVPPTATPTPSPSSPTTVPNLYACAPPAPGRCALYADPDISQCPKVWVNDPTCNDECTIRENACHDERGKRR